MELARDRVGPYVRALRVGLHALAPNDDHVPLAQALRHLRALDPALSGDLLLPAEVDDRSGLPAVVWMERALAEQAVAEGADPDRPDGDLERAAALDPALGARMRHRAALHEQLRRGSLLPASRLVIVARRRHPTEDYRAAFDLLSPTGLWVRLRVDFRGGPGWADGLLVVHPDGKVTADVGMRHLFARHAATPLLAMARQLAVSTGARITRLARSAVGPFWFPGFPLPEGVPPAFGRGLLLHLATEVLGEDVHRSAHRDPWQLPHPDDRPPDGYGIYRERRFAASAPLIGPARDWARGRGCDVMVVPLG